MCCVLLTDNNRTSVCFPITTSDTMEVTAHLVFAYEIQSVDKVAQVQDPIARMHAGLVADSQKLGATMASEQPQAGHQAAVTACLETHASFRYLRAAAEASGMQLTGVRVLGLKFSAELQKQADREQQLSAGLCAELAEKTQRRELRELELEDERKQREEEAELERMRAEVRAEVEAEAHGVQLVAVQRRIELERAEGEAKRRVEEQEDQRVLHFLRALKTEGVEMTQFMCAAGGLRVAAPALARTSLLQEEEAKTTNLAR